MGIPVSLSGSEFAVLTGLAVVLILVAAFVALFLSAIIGLGIARLLYVGGSWCVKRIRESGPADDLERTVRNSVSGTRLAPVPHSSLRLATRL